MSDLKLELQSPVNSEYNITSYTSDFNTSPDNELKWKNKELKFKQNIHILDDFDIEYEENDNMYISEDKSDDLNISSDETNIPPPPPPSINHSVSDFSIENYDYNKVYDKYSNNYDSNTELPSLVNYEISLTLVEIRNCQLEIKNLVIQNNKINKENYDKLELEMIKIKKIQYVLIFMVFIMFVFNIFILSIFNH